MRPALFVAAAVALAAVEPPDALRDVLATTAAVLFEAVPFLIAARLLVRAGRSHRLTSLLGCGCGDGPTALSLPAAIATAMFFGPALAAARFAAAVAISRVHPTRTHRNAHGILSDVAAMLPAAILCGIAARALPAFVHASSPAMQLAFGAIAGFAAAPCALGSVAVAAALHARAPLAAASFLCVAGLVDARTTLARAPGACTGDAVAYGMLCVACAIVALRHGAELVHPFIAYALGGCAVGALLLFLRHRREHNPAARFAPAIMLAGALANAPVPAYVATETNLAGAFPGEHVAFTGVLARDGATESLERFAIVCCRADATPVALRLDKPLAFASGTWLHAEGAIVARGPSLRFEPTRVDRVAPPPDPFVYR